LRSSRVPGEASYRAEVVPRRLLDIRWSTKGPEALALRLRQSGFELDANGVLALPSATLCIEMSAGPVDGLKVTEGETRPANVVPRQPNGVADVLAIGWATVDWERFVAGLGPDPIGSLPRDPHLGAFVLRYGRAEPAVLVLEPDTEGRLAATLARSGEGPVAIYLGLGPGELTPFIATARRRGALTTTVRPGPFGPSVLLAGGPAWGPHVLVVERPDRHPASPGTIPS
jgi:hypothetical protein